MTSTDELLDSYLQDWAKPVPELEQLQAAVMGLPVPELIVPRVDQLDAGVLDAELTKLLHMQLQRVCSLFPQGFMERYKHELDALLRLLLWRFTVWEQAPTPGMRLQNLR
jgi:peroxin-2